MARTLIVNLTDELEQALTMQAQKLNKSLEEIVLELLSWQLPPLPQTSMEASTDDEDDDPLLALIGSIHVEGIHATNRELEMESYQ